MASEKLKTRRRYEADFRAQILAQCDVPGASVAQVAMAHGIKANVVHRWRQLAREGAGVGRPAVHSPLAGGFLPVMLPSAPVASVGPAAPGSADIRIELRRGGTTMLITWPSVAAEQFAGFARELLK
jgi:transposase